LYAAEKLALARNAQNTTVVTLFYNTCIAKIDKLYKVVIEYNCRYPRCCSCMVRNS